MRAGDGFAIGVAKGKVEDALVVVIDQGEDLVRLDHAHFGAGFIGLNGFGDKFLDLVPKVAVALVHGQLDDIGRRLGNLEDLAVDDGDTGGFLRAPGQKFGDGDLQGVSDVLKGGEFGIAFDAGEEVAGVGAHPVGDIGYREALGPADVFEVLFYRFHIGHICWKQR